MIIDLNSSAIQELKRLHSQRVVSHKSSLFILSGVYNAIAYKVANNLPVCQAEIASIVGVNRKTVYRAVERLREFGFLEKAKGKAFATANGVKKEFSRYKLLIESEYKVFKKIVIDSIKRLKDYIGEPIKKNHKKYYSCPCCNKKKFSVNAAKEKGFCHECQKVYNDDNVKFINYKKRESVLEVLVFRGRSWALNFIQPNVL